MGLSELLCLQPGMVVSLHEALTPSPLFTWYSPTSATADIQMADLDTCVKYNTAATTNSNGVSEFHGSTTFTGGRHRWTVQLDNAGQHAGHIFVGLVSSEPGQAPSSSILAATLPTVLAGRALGANGMPSAGATPAAAAQAGLPGSSTASAAPVIADAVPVAAAAAGASSMTGAGLTTATSLSLQRGKWGVWVKLPGVLGANSLTVPHQPPREGNVQVVESQSNHCCITVDLDLIGGYAKFFRNGHLLGQAFTGLAAPISPSLGFLQVCVTMSHTTRSRTLCPLITMGSTVG